MESGTFYVWVRARRGFSGGNSVHVGLNGREIPSADRIEIDDDLNWEWTSDTKDDVRATLEIATPACPYWPHACGCSTVRRR